MEGIIIQVLGESGPFSSTGNNTGYELEMGDGNYLLDCGAPLFQLIGGHGLKKSAGVIITHCHEDHKRWLGDLALFGRYAPDASGKVHLFASESVYETLREATTPALTRGLADDFRSVIDIAFEEFIEHHLIGPRARYRIVPNPVAKPEFLVTDRQRNVLPPGQAKVIISPKTNRPRMLFLDPSYGEWVEPESFYSFSSVQFYEENKNVHTNSDGSTIEALKAPVWHGIAGTGIKIKRGGETLIFSSDTVHDKMLWKELCAEKRVQKLPMTRSDFESAPIIYGDINDYIERTWSEERYEEAINAFRDAAVIHDISVNKSLVHTNYERLGQTTLDKGRTLLTHGPDRLTSEWALCNAGKTFMVKGGKFLEIVGDACFPMNGDVFHKEKGKYYVGYRSDRGAFAVYKKEGLLQFASHDGTDVGRPLFRVDLYEDISGRYFPALTEASAQYFKRRDGKVELMRFDDKGSRGVIVEDHRARLAERGANKP